MSKNVSYSYKKVYKTEWNGFNFGTPDLSKLALFMRIYQSNIDGLVQDCSNSIANALELLQYFTNCIILSSISIDIIGSSAGY